MAGGKVICIGDTTTHGGTVIEGDPSMLVYGRAVARVGDKVACPACAGIYPIVEGNTGMSSNGRQIAYEGCKTACGAFLVAQEVPFNHKVPTNGAATQQTQQTPATIKNDEPYCSGKFRIIDKLSGRPRAFQKINIKCSDGQQIECMTDGEGYTPIIKTEKPESVNIQLAGDK